MKKLLLGFLICVGSLFAQQTQHGATLNWTQSVSPGVTGNNVFRGLTTGGPYTLLTATPLTAATTYVDSTVVASQTYFYVVTALVGTEQSAYSVEAKAVIPADTLAPAGLTVQAK